MPYYILPISSVCMCVCFHSVILKEIFLYFFQVQVSQLCLEGRCIHDFLIDTTTFLSHSFNIMLQLIEPSLLFCLLPSARKYNLLTRGFISSEVRGFRNVVTFGLHYPEAAILDDVSIFFFFL